MSAVAGAETAGRHYHGFVSGYIAHGDKGKDGSTYREDARYGEQRAFPHGLMQHAKRFVRVVALEVVYGYDDLIADQDEGIQIAQADLPYAVLVHEYSHDAEDCADNLEYCGECESFEFCDGNERNGRVAACEAYHWSEEHGNEQSCCNNEEDGLYSLYHLYVVSVDFADTKIGKNKE